MIVVSEKNPAASAAQGAETASSRASWLGASFTGLSVDMSS